MLNVFQNYVLSRDHCHQLDFLHTRSQVEVEYRFPWGVLSEGRQDLGRERS